MSELDRALADIDGIRRRLAASAVFQGFGPPVVAVTGALALGTGAAQSLWASSSDDALLFFATWGALAAACTALIGLEMLARTRRRHGGLADAMVFNAVEHFLPVAAMGAAVGAIVLRFAPDTAWVLPGLWEMLMGVGLFVAVRFLPRSIVLAGAWYFVSGALVLILTSSTRSLMPWTMAIPFGVGQGLMAALLHFAQETRDARETADAEEARDDQS